MIISIGLQCTNASLKNKIKKTYTLPFDWMFATPSFVYEMLELLLEKNINIEDLVKNYFFKIEKKVNLKTMEHFYTDDNGTSLYNTKYNVIFPHDEYNNDTINKYIRRFERLKQLILNSNDCLYFIYTSQSSLDKGNFTIDGKNIINNVYINISKIYNLISKFRNNYKIIIFDAIQEENIELLDKNIILYKLNKCDYWNDLLPQMKKCNIINNIKDKYKYWNDLLSQMKKYKYFFIFIFIFIFIIYFKKQK